MYNRAVDRRSIRFLLFASILLACSLLLMFLYNSTFAQTSAQQSVEYAENGTDPVLTLRASDPEGVMPIVWSLLQDAGGVQNLGIITDTPPAGSAGPDDDVVTPDIADRDLFDISENGVLTFKKSPDFEGMSNSGDDNYQVVVQASDGGEGQHVNWFKVTVTVTDEEETGNVTWMGMVDPDGSGTDRDLRQFNANAVLTATPPTDPDGAVTNIRWQWYRTSSPTADGEAIDGATSIMYAVSDASTSNDVGKYLRVEATYSDPRGPNKKADFVSEHPVQAARDDNTVPSFALTGVTREITEDNKGNIGSPVTATDADGDLLTYSLSTADAGLDNTRFSIDRATGQLKVGSTPLNFEMPADEGITHPDPDETGAAGDNIYEVKIIATDSSGGDSTVVTVHITVTDLNEKPTFGNASPEGMLPDQAEGMTAIDSDTSTAVVDALEPFTATDPEGGNVTLSLMGDDAAMFTLAADADPDNGVSRVLSFKGKPDFEMSEDSNDDNIYEVTVEASDGINTATRSVTVKVTDADEDGTIAFSSPDVLIGVELTATLTDSDGDVPDTARFMDQKWQWHRLGAPTDTPGTAAPNDNDISGATSATYTPVFADKDMFLKAVVTYTDRTRDEDNEGGNNAASDDFVPFRNMVTSAATIAVRNNPDNQAPKFAEGTSTFRLVEENTEALSGTEDDDDAADATDDNVGGPIMAEDDDGDTPTYTLSGTTADMFRVRANGQIEVSDKANLNHEADSSHTVMLTADDGYGGSSSATTITVTIHVTDLDEKPTINDKAAPAAIGEQSVTYVENGTASVLELRASDPEGVTPIVWSLLQDAGGVQNLGIITDTPPAGSAGPDDDVVTPDIADRALFDISENGVLTFKKSPDFEGMSNSGDDNYQVVVQASDGGEGQHVNWFKVTVTVTDEEETGNVTWMGMIDPDGAGAPEINQDLRQFNADAVLTATTPTDPDGPVPVTNIRWQWYRTSSPTADGEPIDGATSDMYSVVDSPTLPNDVGKYLRVEATYSDSRGDDKTADFVSEYPVQADRDDNTDPSFASTGVSRRTAENNKGNIGSPVTATDVDRQRHTDLLAGHRRPRRRQC